MRTLGHDVAAYNRGLRRREEVRALGFPVYDDLEKMLDLERAQADAVVVCTPNHLHVQHALAAARRGLHLFIEKPVSHERFGLDALKGEVEDRNLILHVGANMRFHFGPATVKRLLDSGKVGRPLWASFWGGMHLPDWHPNEDYRGSYSAKQSMGGGAVLDFIHELDLVLWMFDAPEHLAAMTSQSGWLQVETEDVGDAILSYRDGFQVNVHLDYLQRPFQRGIRVVGERGWVHWDLAREEVVWFDHVSREAQTVCYPEHYSHDDMYVEQMRGYVECLSKGEESASDLSAGRRALELALRIKASSANRQFLEWDEPC